MFRLTRKERERLGEKFAELLLYGGDNMSIDQLTSLTNRKDWQSAERREKKQAIAEIARRAQEVLLQCGYDKAVVRRKTEPFIRY